MPLAPEIAQLLASQATDSSFVRPGSGSMPIDEARLHHEADAVRFTPVDARDAIDNLTTAKLPEGPAGQHTRIYRPSGLERVPILIWFHGGGWVTGSLDTADIAARALCARAGMIVVTSEYPLAPEQPWPAAFEYAEALSRWVRGHSEQLGGNGVVLIGGDSAGGNIAACVAAQNHDLLDGQILIYPVIDLHLPSEAYRSRIDNGSGYYVGWDDVAWAIEQYAPDTVRADPRVSPSQAAGLQGAPPAVIVVVEYDPLRDEGRAYADRLQRAGVHVVLLEFPGLVHGAFDMLGLSPDANAAMWEVAQELHQLGTARH